MGRTGDGRAHRLRLASALAAGTLATAVLLSGCGDTSQSDHGSAPADAPAPDSRKDSAAGADKAAPGGAERQPGGKGAPADLRIDQRSIIYTGSIVVRVEDVDRAAASATSIATGAGGFVGADKRTSNDSRSEASLQLRVPADRFNAVVDRIAGLGDQERRDINTEDVTEESLDLDARIATQRARVDSGRRLLAQAKTLNELILLEGELAKREADLASLEAKKRRLDDLTALSTITAVLLGPNAQADEPQTGFLVGLKGGWRAFLASMEILLTVLGALLPWVIALGVPGYGLFWLIRRLARRHRPVPAGPMPPRAPRPVPAAQAHTASTPAPPARAQSASTPIASAAPDPAPPAAPQSSPPAAPEPARAAPPPQSDPAD